MSDFVNNISEINNFNALLQGQQPTTVITRVAEKMGIEYGGKTPEKVYREIRRGVPTDGVEVNLSSARSALLVTLNGARDALGGPEKQNLAWTKRIFAKPVKKNEQEPKPKIESKGCFESASDKPVISKNEIDYWITYFNEADEVLLKSETAVRKLIKIIDSGQAAKKVIANRLLRYKVLKYEGLSTRLNIGLPAKKKRSCNL